MRNTARVAWSINGRAQSAASNEVITQILRDSAEMETFRPEPGADLSALINSSSCNGKALPVPQASLATGTTGLLPANSFYATDDIIFRIVSAAANTNPSAIDSVRTTLTATSGDQETVTVFETGPNTGVFIGSMPTRLIPPAPVRNDCALSVAPNDQVLLETSLPDSSAVIASTTILVLVDPYGLVFDSDNGDPVNGVTVSMVDAVTGAPAEVYADDGVTRWPSTVVTGSIVTDASGNKYQMQKGEYRFPLAPHGTYRLTLSTPAPYSAPSTSTPAQLAVFHRPGGGALHLFDSSYQKPFVLAGTEALRVDIPIDRPKVLVAISKTSSRSEAAPGDPIVYNVVARNPDPERFKRGVVVVDTPSSLLRLREDSITVDGVQNPSAITVSADGRKLTINLGDLAPSQVRTLSYVMTVRADAPEGQAINRAVASDIRGNTNQTALGVRITRDTVTARMTIVGRISAGDCSMPDRAIGIPGVRVMLEDGSFAVTDHDGRYHFEGVVPGTHVVQAQGATLPEGGHFVDCVRGTRSAGKPNSRLVTGQGGSLVQVDFAAVVPEGAIRHAAQVDPKEAEDLRLRENRHAAGADIDFLAIGDGPDGFLFPAPDFNPRVPSVRVAVRHRADQKVELRIDDRVIDKMAFEGAKVSADKRYAVSIWAGIPLENETSRLVANLKAADGKTVASFTREVRFAAEPQRAELVREKSRLVADGRTRPVIALRILDRAGRPVHAGLSGEVALSAPYESAAAEEEYADRLLAGLSRPQPTWVVKGDDGIAYIELSPTLVSGPLSLTLQFGDRETRHSQVLNNWVEPGDVPWTLVGLAEGSIGAKTVRDAMVGSEAFDSDLGDKARVAFYAKGRVLGKVLLTIAYDSAKQKRDQRLLGAIDPDAYYTVYGDRSERVFDAASREKLYVRMEGKGFYGLYGDFRTDHHDVQLSRYDRTATGVKAGVKVGALQASGFAAKTESTHRHDTIQGNGLSGPYQLSARQILSNSEYVTIVTKDRLRSEVIVSEQPLTRFLDYDIDADSGLIRLSQPLASRDSQFNPQFLVVDYEVLGVGASHLNAGGRAELTLAEGRVRVGASAISDRDDTKRTNLAAVDAKVKVDQNTEVRAEVAGSRNEGETSYAWLVEAEHHSQMFDAVAYARSIASGYGLGQLENAENGRRKFGVDGRVRLTEELSLVGRGWIDDSLTDQALRHAIELSTVYNLRNSEFRLGMSRYDDRLANGSKAGSTTIDAGVRQRFLGGKLELGGSANIAVGSDDSIDLPSRYTLDARYNLTRWMRAVAAYEISDGSAVRSRSLRGGLEFQPWRGARMVGTLGRQDFAENGRRAFAAFGANQTFQITDKLSIDGSFEVNRTLGRFDATRIINPEQPAASGGFLGDNGQKTENFTATTLGLSWRDELWSATLRGEYRDGQYANRRSLIGGIIRQLGNGVVVGAGGTYTSAQAVVGGSTRSIEAQLAAAFRPESSDIAGLAKLEYREDEVSGSVAGQTLYAARTALGVDGGLSRRLVGSLSMDWTPDHLMTTEYTQRSALGLFVGARYGLDRVAATELSGLTLMGGTDVRLGLGERLELGFTGTVRGGFDNRSYTFSYGPEIGVTPMTDMLLTIGYNFSGFHDRDFASLRTTDDGVYVSVRMTFDADLLSTLGLAR